MKVTILGCGSSSGVPIIGCECGVCRSGNPKNRRSRVSLFVEYDSGAKVLVDTSPDLRAQALSNKISDVDAVFYTHDHADHTHGIDDMRPFNIRKNAEIPAYATAETLRTLQQRFNYIWQPHEGGYWTRAALQAHSITAGQLVEIASGERVQSFGQLHGKGESLGLRFGDIVYSTDTNGIPAVSQWHLQNMAVWIVDCLRDGFAGSHANLEMALDWIATFKPKLAILTHMNHELDYDALRTRLPANVIPAYDGLCVEVTAHGKIRIKT